jgi:hypothetical protein
MNCPFCARELEGKELKTGLCSSDDCPRHDIPETDPSIFRTKIKQYNTLSGNTGAEIFKHPSGLFSYIGKWGAGSGLDRSGLRQLTDEWERTKRKISISIFNSNGTQSHFFPKV